MMTVTVSGGVVVVIGLVSSVAFATNHVDHAEGRDDVGDEEPRQHLVETSVAAKQGGRTRPPCFAAAEVLTKVLPGS